MARCRMWLLRGSSPIQSTSSQFFQFCRTCGSSSSSNHRKALEFVIFVSNKSLDMAVVALWASQFTKLIQLVISGRFFALQPSSAAIADFDAALLGFAVLSLRSLDSACWFEPLVGWSRSPVLNVLRELHLTRPRFTQLLKSSLCLYSFPR